AERVWGARWECVQEERERERERKRERERERERETSIAAPLWDPVLCSCYRQRARCAHTCGDPVWSTSQHRPHTLRTSLTAQDRATHTHTHTHTHSLSLT